MNAAQNDIIPNGTRVLVRHDQGTEVGTVIGRSNPAMPDDYSFGKYDVQFDDGTISWWHWARVSRILNPARPAHPYVGPIEYRDQSERLAWQCVRTARRLTGDRAEACMAEAAYLDPYTFS